MYFFLRFLSQSSFLQILFCVLFWLLQQQLEETMEKSQKHRSKKMSEQQNRVLIDKYRNFPTLPPIQKLAGKHQDPVLSQCFPWGCAKLCQPVDFSRNDMILQNRFPDFSNICLSIKYGVCPFLSVETLKFMIDAFKQVNQANGSLYIKLIESKQKVHHRVLALVRVTSIKPGRTFRFWNIKKGHYYPIGVAMIQVIAVGEIKNQEYSFMEDIYKGLKRTMLDWNYFQAADALEQIQRQKCILAINRNQHDKLEKQLQENNLSTLNLFPNS